MAQINIVQSRPAPQLETLYGAAMTDDQKRAAVGITAGVLVGVVLFIVVRKAKKSKRR